MNLEALALRRAEEQTAVVADLAREEKAARAAQFRENLGIGVPMTDDVCPVCRVRRLAITNRSGVCYKCSPTPLRRKRRAKRRADADTIARARARLAARGIYVEAA